LDWGKKKKLKNLVRESSKPAGIVVQRKEKNCRRGELCKENERISNGEGYCSKHK
jgi:hypothetical protein